MRLRVHAFIPGFILAVSAMAAFASERVLEPVGLSTDGRSLELQITKKEFRVWGVNYDHDSAEPNGRLIEDYWMDEWDTVVSDFREMKELGANVVRIHLQFGKFMASPDEANDESLAQLQKLLVLAEDTGVYLNITGLGCYHQADVPPWYDALDEASRWKAQARFWFHVASACRESNAVFCYDLMNEPVIGDGKEKGWLAGELGGKHYVQRITLDKGTRSSTEIAAKWVKMLVTAIRETGATQLITVGVIPWSHVWPNAKPVFYSPEAVQHLDIVSIHLYPKSGEIQKAVDAMRAYEIGKPLIIEETFPLSCSVAELTEFMKSTKKRTCGYFSFYWGTTAAEYARDREKSLKNHLMHSWLIEFKRLAGELQ